jgi:hypothetical protein
MAVVTVGAMLVTTGCDRRPGYNAYGRYPSSATSSSSDAVYDRLKNDKDEWYKDRPN